MTRARGLRILRVSAPFVLLALGTAALAASPWPTIVRLMLQGRRVVVGSDLVTVAKGVAGLACFAGALALSYGIRLERR